MDLIIEIGFVWVQLLHSINITKCYSGHETFFLGIQYLYIYIYILPIYTHIDSKVKGEPCDENNRYSQWADHNKHCLDVYDELISLYWCYVDNIILNYQSHQKSAR